MWPSCLTLPGEHSKRLTSVRCNTKFWTLGSGPEDLDNSLKWEDQDAAATTTANGPGAIGTAAASPATIGGSASASASGAATAISAISGGSAAAASSQQADGMAHVVSAMRKRYGLQYVYVWHALAGYWCGVSPSDAELAHLQVREKGRC